MIIISVLQKRKQRPSEAQELAQFETHRVSPEPTLLSYTLDYSILQ